MKSKNRIDIGGLEEIFMHQIIHCDPAVKQQHVDSQMIGDGKSSTANMPSQDITKQFNDHYVEKLYTYDDLT